MEKYDHIGIGYNQTRQADPYLLSRIVHHLAPEVGKTYLEIGCGTGNYTAAIASQGYQIIGIDPSEHMLAIASELHPNMHWLQGRAERTNMKEDTIDGIFAFLTIHHWNDLYESFKELYSVLKPNSKFVIFTSSPDQMKGYWLNHYFPKMLNDSIQQMPSMDLIKDALDNAGFKIDTIEKYFVQPDLRDKFLYCGKDNPQLYFLPEIRSGISSFSDLSNQLEVINGLTQLKEDIESKKFLDVQSDYNNDKGDYQFIICRN